MTEYTQRELLKETFWGKVGNVAKGVGNFAKGVGHMVDFALPELTQPFKQAYNGISNLNQKIISATTPLGTKIKNGLWQQGYKMIGNNITELKDPNQTKWKTAMLGGVRNDTKRYMVTVHKLMIDPRTNKPVNDPKHTDITKLVDSNGHFLHDSMRTKK